MSFHLEKKCFWRVKKGDRIRRILLNVLVILKNSTFVQCFELKHTSTNVDRYIDNVYKPPELFLNTYGINR